MDWTFDKLYCNRFAEVVVHFKNKSKRAHFNTELQVAEGWLICNVMPPDDNIPDEVYLYNHDEVLKVEASKNPGRLSAAHNQNE